MNFEVSHAPSRGLDLRRLLTTHFCLQFEDFFQLGKELTEGPVIKFGAAGWDEGTAARASRAGGQIWETQRFHHCSLLLPPLPPLFFSNLLRVIRSHQGRWGVLQTTCSINRQHFISSRMRLSLTKAKSSAFCGQKESPYSASAPLRLDEQKPWVFPQTLSHPGTHCHSADYINCLVMTSPYLQMLYWKITHCRTLTLKLVGWVFFHSQLVLAKGNGALWAMLHPQARVMSSPLNPGSKTTFTFQWFRDALDECVSLSQPAATSSLSGTRTSSHKLSLSSWKWCGEKYSLFSLLVYTYFYKGKEYWKFDNQRLSVEPGYPRSILKDWMGCNQKDVERSKDRRLPHDDVDIMVTINDVPSTVNAIAVVIPCILSLCILVLVYTIFQFKNKEVQQNVVYYKRPVQEWVWHSPLHVSAHWSDEDYGQKKRKKKKQTKKRIQKPIKQNYFSDLQVLDSLGLKEAGKLDKNTGSLAVWSLFLSYCLSRVSVSVCHPPQARSATAESSGQVTTDLGIFLQFPAPVLPVKPSIRQCSWTTSEQNHFFNSCLINELRSWNLWTGTIQYRKQKTFWCWSVLQDLLSLLQTPGDYLDTIFQYLLVRCFVHS